MEITQQLLKELFEYKDGSLYWKIKIKRINPGDRAGWFSKERYSICIKGKNYLAARLIFLFHYNYLPVQVDHKNRIRSDDRIENLRAASVLENNRNVSSHKDSSSKYLGVSWHIRRNKWYANIRVNQILMYLGCYHSEIQAALAYNEAAKIHFGEFANLNIIE
mgnify:CR=1 FL=1